jgi:hypothetical protein
MAFEEERWADTHDSWHGAECLKELLADSRSTAWTLTTASGLCGFIALPLVSPVVRAGFKPSRQKLLI